MSCRKNMGYSLRECLLKGLCITGARTLDLGERAERLIKEVAVMIFEIFAKLPGNVFF